MSTAAIQQAKQLLRLASQNQPDKIYKILSAPMAKSTTKYKGDVFEYFIAGLYEGLGYIAVVGGGKNDKGADIVLYKGRSQVRAEAVIQAKNYKTPVSKDTLRTTYIKFFGDHFSGEDGCTKIYQCKHFIIITLNGFIQNADKFSPPKGCTIDHYDWSHVSSLIEEYAKQNPPEQHPYLRWIGIVALLGLVIFGVTRCAKPAAHPVEDKVETLSADQVRRLHKIPNNQAVKRDCDRYKFKQETCPEQLVHLYRDQYGNGDLSIGVQVYFCGVGNFKKGQCDKLTQKAVEYVFE
ncbi:MAG: restriction endonuclease [Thiotrichaceae bacterium]|nr:restriction endonuclease [Thiotrichaceae bacterium]